MTYLDWLERLVIGGSGGGGGYPEPTGSININQNGNHNVKDYASAVVTVPNPSSGSLNITANGTYDVTEKASAVVNVSGGGGGMIDVPDGYTLKEMTRKIPISTVSGIKLSNKSTIQVDTAVADTISANDKVCIHAKYASSATSTTNYGDVWVWGTVNSKSGTASAYRSVVIAVAGVIVEPSSNQSKSVTNNSNVNALGYSTIVVAVPEAYTNTNVSFASEPTQYGVVDFIISSTAPQVNSDAFLIGTFNNNTYVVFGRVDNYDSINSKVTVFVNNVVVAGGGGSGYKYLTGITFNSTLAAQSTTFFDYSGGTLSQGDNIIAVGNIVGSQDTYIAVGSVSQWWSTSGSMYVDTVYKVGGAGTLITKTINADGTYNAIDDNADGYSSVTVSTGGGGGGSTFPDIDNITWGQPPMPNQVAYSNGDFTPYMSTISVGNAIWVRGTYNENNTFLAFGTVRDINAQFLEINVFEVYDAVH